ncbi:MAG: hypothetical protein OZ924_03225 [Burkholderiaceae bacterium]|jgi:hypothetical protein|nr:hypothetical protein [Burkholderiaceae bacterium]
MQRRTFHRLLAVAAGIVLAAPPAQAIGAKPIRFPKPQWKAPAQ